MKPLAANASWPHPHKLLTESASIFVPIRLCAQQCFVHAQQILPRHVSAEFERRFHCLHIAYDNLRIVTASLVKEFQCQILRTNGEMLDLGGRRGLGAQQNRAHWAQRLHPFAESPQCV